MGRRKRKDPLNTVLLLAGLVVLVVLVFGRQLGLGAHTITDHPYMLFKNIEDTPGYKYGSQQPYAYQLTQIRNTADTAKGRATVTTNDWTNSDSALNCAYMWQYTKDASYLTCATLYLNGAGDHWQYTEYPNSNNKDSFGVIMGYSLAYDMVANDLDAAADTSIRDKLARLVYQNWDHMRRNKVEDSANVHTSTGCYHRSGDPVSLYKCDGDAGIYHWHYDVGGFVKQSMGTLVGALALYDYNGEYGNMVEIAEDAETNLFVRNIAGGPYHVFRRMHARGGKLVENGYRHYYIQDYISGLAIYKQATGESLYSKYPQVKGSVDQELQIVTPEGTSANVITNWRPIWGYERLAPYIADGVDKLYHQWYNNRILNNPPANSRWFASVHPILELAYYDKMAAEAEPPRSYADAGNGISILRSNYNKDGLWVYFKTDIDGAISGHQAGSAHHLSYDVWALGAYTLIDEGNPRWKWTKLSLSGGGENNLFIDGFQMVRYSRPYFYTSIPELKDSDYDTDFGYTSGRVYIQKVIDASVRGAREFSITPVDWTRDIMFPQDAVISVDHLKSSIEHNYDILLQYGGNSPGDTAASTLKIEDTSVSWGGLGWSDSLAYTGNKIEWTTKSIDRKDVVTHTYIMPTGKIKVERATMHFGNYGDTYDYYHPRIHAIQQGSNVDYLVAHYFTYSGDPAPTFTPLDTEGNALKVVNGANIDLIFAGDGRTQSAEGLSTNAESGFARITNGELIYGYVKGASTFNYNGREYLNGVIRETKKFMGEGQQAPTTTTLPPTPTTTQPPSPTTTQPPSPTTTIPPAGRIRL